MRARWPLWSTILAASLGILVLAAIYVAGLRLSLESSQPGSEYTANQRDALYLAVHGIVLLLALILGFTIGKMARGQGFSWSLLFGLMAISMMTLTLIGSHELACTEDVNDLVRHWQCSPTVDQAE